jgi:tetratricopeptide (TPR) repeat protein
MALAHADRALALNRNSAWAHTIRAGILTYGLARTAEGRDEALVSLRLNPRDRTGPMAASVVSATYYFERNYAAAAETAQRYLTDYPEYMPLRRYLVAALGQLGKHGEAATALQDFIRAAPRVFEAMVRQRPPYMRPEHQAHLLEGIRKAGWKD